MHGRLRRIVLLLVLLALAGAGVWLWQGRKTAANGGDTISGTIETTEVTVSAESTGRVSAVSAAEGDVVRAGQELVAFDDSLLLAQRKQAEANLAAAQGTLAAAEANATAAQAQLDQVQAGARPQEIRAEEEAVAAAQARVDIAQAQLEQARGALQAAQATRSQAVAKFAQVKDGARVPKCSNRRLHRSNKLRPRSAWPRLTTTRSRTEPTRARCRNHWRWSAPRSPCKPRKPVTTRWSRARRPRSWTRYAPVSTRPRQVSSRPRPRSARPKPHWPAQAPGCAEEARLELVRAGAREEQVEAAEAQLAAIQAQAEAARGQVAASRAGLGVIDEQLARMIVEAPIDGVVLSRPVEPGEVALAGGTLLVLGDLQHLTVTVYLAEDRYGTIQVGQAARVTVDSFPGRVFTGTVQRIADKGEYTPRNVQTPAGRRAVVFAIKMGVENAGGEVKPGMSADVVFER